MPATEKIFQVGVVFPTRKTIKQICRGLEPSKHEKEQLTKLKRGEEMLIGNFSIIRRK